MNAPNISHTQQPSLGAPVFGLVVERYGSLDDSPTMAIFEVFGDIHIEVAEERRISWLCILRVVRVRHHSYELILVAAQFVGNACLDMRPPIASDCEIDHQGTGILEQTTISQTNLQCLRNLVCHKNTSELTNSLRSFIFGSNGKRTPWE